jgi:hypothetical protein
MAAGSDVPRPRARCCAAEEQSAGAPQVDLAGTARRDPGGRPMLIALHVVALGVVLTTFLPFIRRGYWWVRIWDFPRAQIAAIGLVDLAALVLIGSFDALQGWLVAALALAVGYQATASGRSRRSPHSRSCPARAQTPLASCAS